MKAITKKDLLDFFAYMDESCPENPCKDQKADDFQDALAESGAINDLMGMFFTAMLLGGPKAASSSLWATGFQIGREFEARRLELVGLAGMLKGRKGSNK